MPMNPRLLRPLASAVLPEATARDSSDNIIAPTDYVDASGKQWRAHIFTANGKLTFTRPGKAEYLVVAGGGGGGMAAADQNFSGGAGGAGGLLTNYGSASPFNPGEYTVTVGSGGAGGVSGDTSGKDGTASALGAITTVGGGGGGTASFAGGASAAGRLGGSGGGAGGVGLNAGASGGGATAGQGNSGGSKTAGVAAQGGGGGGGATAAGSPSVNGVASGGAGLVLPVSGVDVEYARGGNSMTPFTVTDPGAAGAANTGNGGQSSRGTATSAGGAGGSGIVVVRYLRSLANGLNPETQDWITAVYAAGSSVNTATANAVDQFVSGCKSDGIWDAIKACCVLCGPDTLAGALVPLVGTAPTNNNFVAGDYNRLTGLVGNGSTKFLDANRLATDDPQDDYHQAVYASAAPAATTAMYIGNGDNSAGASNFYKNSANLVFRSRSNLTNDLSGEGSATGFIGFSRSSSSEFVARSSGSNNTLARTSASFSGTANTFVFRWGSASFYSNARIAFYSIGESLDLALLDTRVSALITAIGNS